MKRITVTLTDAEYELLWEKHIETRLPVAQIIVKRALSGLEKPKEQGGNE